MQAQAPNHNTDRGCQLKLQSMIRERRLTKSSLLTEEFKDALDQLRDYLFDSHAFKVWLALSVARRAGSISSPMDAVFLPEIKARLTKPLPAWTPLEDGEDRYYLAKALQSSPNHYIVDRAFIELSHEDGAEKARRIWAEIAFEHSQSKEEFLIKLNNHLHQLVRSQSLPVDSLIRRIRRINTTIVPDLATADKTTGTEFGQALRAFYAGSALAVGPDDRKLREESAITFLTSLRYILRLNFYSAAQPEPYRVLATLRRWWQPSSPPETFNHLSRQIARLGVETLHLYARQGIQNKLLRQALVTACGTQIVEQLAKSLADTDTSLSEEMSHWFVHGTEPVEQKSTPVIEALQATRLVDHISRLLIATSSPELDFRSMQSVADQVSVLMPTEADALFRTSSRVAQITSWTTELARLHNIELFGARRQVVSYDPAVHEARDDIALGAKAVISVPGAIHNVPGRQAVLLIRAEVRTL